MTPRLPPRFRECKECNETFKVVNSRSFFCSRACYQKDWSRRNPGYMVEAQRRHLAKPEKRTMRRTRMAEYNQRPEVVARRSELFAVNYQRDPSKHKARVRAYRDGYIVNHTNQEWLDKLAEYRHRCAYCDRVGVKLTKDHVIPVSRGSRETVDLIANIVPACASCNSRKNAKPVEELLRLPVGV